jgi:hypothetical protein
VVFQREFKTLLILCLIFFSVLYRNGGIALKPYGEPSPTVTLSNSNLYNAMIYPFTRIVIYGAIWYQGKKQYFMY